MPNATGVGRPLGEKECRSLADSYSVLVFSSVYCNSRGEGHLLGVPLCLWRLWQLVDSDVNGRLFNGLNMAMPDLQKIGRLSPIRQNNVHPGGLCPEAGAISLCRGNSGTHGQFCFRVNGDSCRRRLVWRRTLWMVSWPPNPMQCKTRLSKLT